ncbi:MAG: PAS domain S-box protein [Nitrospiraceae bacterium]|nr:PAS domain S-box protein [Nitrospiraceae bacterium]
MAGEQRQLQNRIGRRLLKKVLLFSFVVTIIFTVIQAWMDYSIRMSGINETIEQVKKVQVRGLITALWNYDMQELAAEVEGIHHFNYLNYAAVIDRGKLIAQAGQRKRKNVIMREIALTRDYNGRQVMLGTLYLQADTALVVRDVLARIALIFLFQAATVAIVAFFLLWLFGRMVTRHLSIAASYFRSFNVAGMNAPLVLDKPAKDDELDTLAGAFNMMREHLAASHLQQLCAQQEIEESERRFRVLFEQAPDAITVYDQDENRFVDANENAERLFALSREELLKTGPRQIYPDAQPDGRLISESISENIKLTLAGESVALDRLIRCADGKERLCEVRLVRLPSGERRLIRASYIDVTERRQAEKALFYAEKKFRDLLETIQLIAVMLDCDGNVVFCNDYFLGLAGWSRDEALGNNWFDMFLPGENRETVKSVFKSILRDNAPLHYENPIVTREGAKRLIIWDNSVLRNFGGDVIGTASLGIDVTEHRRLEEQLRQAQKMEAIGQLAGGVAHDFNNILCAIVGYAHLALMKMPEGDPVRGNMEQILRASERATTLTRSLLSFSRKQIINPRPNNLTDIIRGLEKFLSRLIREDIEMKIKCGGGEMMIFADRGQIEQMLMNLVTNARDAMPGGGHIAIGTVKVRMDEEFIRMHGYGKPGAYAAIVVSDTGEGMDAKTKERIFEPFFTTREQGKGTGLGLSMVYGIVKQHEGFIDVDSEQGKGAEFRIYLPLVSAAVPDRQRDIRLTEAEGGVETLLVAEDDEAIRQLNTELLRNYGYRIIEAVDGEDAVAKFRQNMDDVQLIIMDGIMPKKNGKEAYEEIRAINPSVRVIYLSGYAEDIISREGLLEPGTNFILKPVTPANLLKKVRDVLDGNSC